MEGLSIAVGAAGVGEMSLGGMLDNEMRCKGAAFGILQSVKRLSGCSCHRVDQLKLGRKLRVNKEGRQTEVENI